MKSKPMMKALKNMNIDQVARAIETDAGHVLPGLRESLAEAKSGVVDAECEDKSSDSRLKSSCDDKPA